MIFTILQIPPPPIYILSGQLSALREEILEILEIVEILMSVESKWRLKIEAQAGDQGVSLEIQ